MLLGFLPDLWLPDIFFSVIWIPFGEMIRHILLHTQSGETIFGQSNTFLKFFYHLIWAHNQMSLGNGKLPHSGKSMHFSRILIAEQGRCLTVTQWQITIGMLFCFIHIILEWTSHRPQRHYLFIFLLISQYKHAVCIVIPVARYLI